MSTHSKNSNVIEHHIHKPSSFSTKTLNPHPPYPHPTPPYPTPTTMNSFNNPTPNFDNLLLQTLLNRLQLHPPPSPPPLQDILFNNLNLDNLNLNLSDSDNESESDNSSPSLKTQLSKEEEKLEKTIIRTILDGNSETLKPNSGQAVTISEHHICVGFHLDSGFEYRVWEWHGHIMLFDEENGYTPEYIYGNYFERLSVKEMVELKNKEKVRNFDKVEEFGGVDDDDDDEKKGGEKDGKVVNLGLKDLIESREGELNGGRIVHRNVNSGSPRF